MPRTVEWIGVSLTVQEKEVYLLSDADQDLLIAKIGEHLQEELRKFVGGATPVGDLAYDVTGPHDDPIQGLIHMHNLGGPFDVDALPLGCAAREVATKDGQRLAAPKPDVAQ